jgi:hypothetical protein
MRETAFKFEISLRIVHPSIDPERITEVLGISPTRSFMAGSRRVTPRGKELPGHHKESFWLYRFAEKSVGDVGTLSVLIQEMNHRLMPMQDFLISLRDGGGRAEYFVGWFTDFNSGEVFDWTILEQCSRLKIDLSLDVYGNRDLPENNEFHH